jgi:F-type H+-transporting ATPase subunit a
MEHAAAGGHEIIKWHIVWMAWLAMALLIGMAVAARPRIGLIPSGLAALFEHIYEYFADLAEGMIGRGQGKRYVPFIMTVFLFILASNWMGLIPYLEAPTSSLNTTLAMAIVSFVAFNFYGIRRNMENALAHGHGSKLSLILKGFVTWLVHFIEPTPTLWRSLEGGMRYVMVPPLCVLFLFLNIVEEVARLISLSMRLFGNMMGEHKAVLTLWGLVIVFESQMMQAPRTLAGAVAGFGQGVLMFVIWGSSLFVTLIGTLAGFIQAFIFAILTLYYISHAVADSH